MATLILLVVVGYVCTLITVSTRLANNTGSLAVGIIVLFLGLFLPITIMADLGVIR